MTKKPVTNWKIFWILYAASIIGIIAIIPYASTIYCIHNKYHPSYHPTSNHTQCHWWHYLRMALLEKRTRISNDFPFLS